MGLIWLATAGEAFMESSSFDRLARALARVQSRRAVAKALGIGGAATCLGRAFAAEPAHPPPAGIAAQAQVAGTPTTGAIQDLAFELEFDVGQIFRFVRDQVAYDPYPGSLRGATGTLQGLAGNAIDQALLLAELLRAAQVETRFVAGELSAAAGARLLAAATLAPAAAKARAQRLYAPAPGASAGAAPTPMAATTAVASPAAEAFRQQFPAFAQRVLASIDRHTADGIATVSGALKQAGITLPAPTPTLPKLERQQHIWLQYANGPAWGDLDPSLPGTEPGHAVATKPTVLAALPDDLLHRVTFRLVAEQVAASGVARNELLRYEAPSRALLGVPLTLLHPQPEATRRGQPGRLIRPRCRRSTLSRRARRRAASCRWRGCGRSPWSLATSLSNLSDKRSPRTRRWPISCRHCTPTTTHGAWRPCGHPRWPAPGSMPTRRP